MIIVITVMMTAVPAEAEIPTVLTDRIRHGDGVIDLFKDITGSELMQQLQEGTLYLGVDRERRCLRE
jgi:hypothetical protein